MSNSNRSKNGLTFLAGVIIGGATLYYLNTPQGKEMTAKAKHKGQELTDQAKAKASDLKAKAEAELKKGKAKASELASTVKSKVMEAKSKVEEILPNQTVKDFKAGVAQAKAKMQNGVEA